jgi:hypothetical protein
VPTDTVVERNEKEIAKNDTIKFISWSVWNDPLFPVLRKPLDQKNMIVILHPNFKVHVRTILSKN